MIAKAACASATLGLFCFASLAQAQAAMPPAGDKPRTKCEGTGEPGRETPVPVDPYPLNAAGWGPELGGGLMFSRWAEDWTGLRAAGTAPRFKAMPIAGATSLTLSGEARLRYDVYDNRQLQHGNDHGQGLLRAVAGADLRLNRNVRVYAEIGAGQVQGRSSTVGANFENDAALQQLFVDARGMVGPVMMGAMIGRQEFADGPRQLVSLSDGPNLHRAWNGVRLYAHGERIRIGAYDVRGTRQQRGFFDEGINRAEKLLGLNASLIVTSPGGPNIYLEPFWIHSERPDFRVGGRSGLDRRDSYGARLWGRRGNLRFDWTLVRQTGDFEGRAVRAWAAFATQTYGLSDAGWKPRVTVHVDLASGGGSNGSRKVKAFNQLYASSNYLGDGLFLSLSNLLLMAPGIALSPTRATTVSAEYGFASRLDERDAAYAGLMRPYAGTQTVPGKNIGGLFRLSGNWAAGNGVTVFVDFEHLAAGSVLRRAGLSSGSYGYVGATVRY